MNIIAFAASSSRESINKQLVTHAAQHYQSKVDSDTQIEILDLNDFEMPIYSIDRETLAGIPDAAHVFFQKITDADALIISYAEHNGIYTAAFKNIFDWASRIQRKVFQDTPMVIMSASVSKNGGANVLKVAIDSAPHFGANVVASFSVGPFSDVFDSSEGCLSDPELVQSLHSSLTKLSLALDV